ncbi:hypothetical protein IG631_08082 [Alternaria alternata]|nr:hypothetical protein IG631_08082 [Alternaria alternata]
MNVSDAELSSLGAVGGESPRETCLRSFGRTHLVQYSHVNELHSDVSRGFL